MVGATPVSESATTQSYSVIEPHTPQGYSQVTPAIPVAVQEGQSVTLEGRTLTILRVQPKKIEYTVNWR
ncbi:hypothetical protein [Methylobacterium sp. Leaf99]|uniref:hypothetical protein n=1 Tax=Methylobacterium sp. Leaf99 TaxID=1736251 RepID=UPI000A594987|nr:hypothetical protein [Methylobacterium sp. Leaf99]